jgi:virginiamycin A acetyltransferase
MEHIINHEAKIADQPSLYTMQAHDGSFPVDVRMYVDSGSFVNNCRVRMAYDTIAHIRIGKFSSIAMDATLMMGSESHQMPWATQWPLHLMPWDDSLPPKPVHPGPNGKWDINIGNDVWIGDSARILSGVTIGDGAVIGTGTVVTKDVPPYAVYVGNPGVIKKYRFSPQEIEWLLGMRWWDLPFEDITRLAPYLFSPDIESLKNRVEQYRNMNATQLCAA